VRAVCVCARIGSLRTESLKNRKVCRRDGVGVELEGGGLLLLMLLSCIRTCACMRSTERDKKLVDGG
jgi:hypothetical protein